LESLQKGKEKVVEGRLVEGKGMVFWEKSFNKILGENWGGGVFIWEEKESTDRDTGGKGIMAGNFEKKKNRGK